MSTMYAPISFPIFTHEPISAVELHTVGMPTRIITKGYPNISGTLAEQKAVLAKDHDHLRKRIICEPRGHSDMFGAILRPYTEHTYSQEANIGVLYIHADGYSNMCGHATIAVARFLVDTHDKDVFPQRSRLPYDPTTRTVQVVLHTLGGLVEVTVPTVIDGSRSDPSRLISFNAPPSHALATDLDVEIPAEHRWPELGPHQSITVSLAFCSAFSCQVTLDELGFPADTLRGRIDFQPLKYAAKQIKEVINGHKAYRDKLKLPGVSKEGTLYGVMVVDKAHGLPHTDIRGAETGLYFFGDQHIDRSPTGSIAAARIALAVRKGEVSIGESWTYHSIVSNMSKKCPGLVATAIREETTNEEESTRSKPIVARIGGHASYTAFHEFVVEDDDFLLDEGGFLL